MTARKQTTYLSSTPGNYAVSCGMMALAVILTCVLYWPGLHGNYLFDDYPNIVDNRAVHVTSPDLENWWIASMASPSRELKRPLAMLSFAANHYATGLNPFWMKATNLLIHLLNGILLFAVLAKLMRLWRQARPDLPASLTSRAEILAALVATAWLLAPINLTGVLYVVQRMTSLEQVFVLAGLWLYLHGRMRQFRGLPGWAWLSAGLLGGTILGLAAKETAVMLPVYALAVEVILLGFRDARAQRSKGLITLFVLIVGMPFLLGMYWLLPGLLDGSAYNSRPFTLIERLLTECRVLVHYLYWTVLPNPSVLSFYHDDILISKAWLSPPGTLYSAALLSCLAGLAFFSLRRAPLLALGLAWFFMAHSLTATVIPLELVYEHRNYFASAGLLLALFSVLLPLTQSKTWSTLGWFLVATAIAWPAIVTAMRVQEWSDPLRLASSEALRHPQSPRAHYELGRTLVIISDYGRKSPALLEEAREAFHAAMQLPNSGILPEQGLLMIAGHTGSAVNPQLLQSMALKMRKQPPSAEDRTALYTLTMCQITGPCQPAPREMLAIYLNALAHPKPNFQLLAGYAQFAAHGLGDWRLAQRVAREAVQGANNQRAIIREALGPILRWEDNIQDDEPAPMQLP